MYGFLWLVFQLTFWPIFIRVAIKKGWFAMIGAKIRDFLSWYARYLLPVFLLIAMSVSANASINCVVTPGLDTTSLDGVTLLTCSMTVNTTVQNNSEIVDHAYLQIIDNVLGSYSDSQWQTVYWWTNQQSLPSPQTAPSWNFNANASACGGRGGGYYIIRCALVMNDGSTVYSNVISETVPGSTRSGYGVGSSSYTAGSTSTPPSSPATGKPGDLSIGIPGIGSIKIPTGWLTDAISYAQQMAAIYSGITSANLKNTFQNMLDSIGLTNDKLTAGFKDAAQNIFTPNQTKIDSLKAKTTQFVEWGPTNYVKSFVTTFTPTSTYIPNPPNTHTDIPTLIAHQNAHVAYAPSVNRYKSMNSEPGSSEATAGTINIPVMTVDVNSGNWSDTGSKVPFDFSPITNNSTFHYMRVLLGAAIYLIFFWFVMMKFWPQQEF